MAKAVLGIPQGMIVYVHRNGGHVLYLSGRSIEGKKHYNLPAELSSEKQPYTNSPADSKLSAHVLVEGQADAISLGQLGCASIALCGVVGKSFDSISHVWFDGDESGSDAALDRSLAIDPLARVVSVKDVDPNDYLIANGTGEALRELLSEAPMAIEGLAEQAGKLKGEERKEAITRLLDIWASLDEITGTDLKPSLAIAMNSSISQFNRLLKSRDKQIEADSNGEKPSPDSYEISPGGFLGGYLFEQCVQYNEDGSIFTYYWVRTPEGKFEKRQMLDIGGTTYKPVDPVNEEMIKDRFVLFASDMGLEADETEILEDIRQFIHKWLDLEPFLERIASYYVLFTWFYDAGFESLVYLRAVGDWGTGKSRFINTIGYLCYRAMIFGGGDSEPIFYYNMHLFKGTMLVDEADFRDSESNALVEKIFNLGNNRDGSIKRLEKGTDGKYRTKVFKIFGPKVFGARQNFQDQASNSRCITKYTGVSEVRADIPREIDERFRNEAERIRNRLLSYRLANWKPMQVDQSITDRTIIPRLAQVTLSLRTIVQNKKTLAELDKYIRLYNTTLMDERQNTTSAFVVQAIVNIHYGNGGLIQDIKDFTLTNIAKVAQELIHEFDPQQEISARQATHIISHQLGIVERGRDRARNGRKCIEVDDALIQQLMSRYGIEKPDF